MIQYNLPLNRKRYLMNEPIDTQNIANGVDNNLETYEQSVKEMQGKRKQVIDRMEETFDSLYFSPSANSDPDVGVVKTKFLEQYRQMLNDYETAERNLINTKLKKKDTDNSSMQAGNFADFLKSIKFSNGVPMEEHTKLTQQELNKIMDKQFEERGCIVLDTELEESDRHLPPTSTTDDD